MVDAVLALPEGTALMLLAPVVRDRKGEHASCSSELRAQGFVRVRVDGDAVRARRAAEARSKRQKHTSKP